MIQYFPPCKEGGSNRLEILPNEGTSLEDYHVVWMLDLMNESINWIQELKQENKNIYYAIYIIYTLKQVFIHNNFTTV